MAPNITDIPIPQENPEETPKPTASGPGNEFRNEENGNMPGMPLVDKNRSIMTYQLRTFLSTINLLAHILIGAVTLLSLIFAFSNGLPITATPIHIVLCVLGYQLLMAEAILSLSPTNGWSSHLRLVDKRRAHLILQIMGSGMAIAGSFVKITDKTEHWTTPHGKAALIALVFTSVSLINGLASLYAHELRGILPGNLSKLGHVCFGSVAFVAAGTTLCYGFAKTFFINWISEEVAYTAITLTAALMFIVIISPMLTFFQKSMGMLRR